MNFKTQGQELPTTNYVNKYIGALTIVEATLTTEATKSAIKGTPALKLNFTTNPVEGLTDESGNTTGQTADHYFYITDATFEGKTMEYNGKKSYMPGVKDNLMIIADALGVREQFDNVGNTANTTDEYLQGVASVLTGKARFKFGGEEVAGKDGKPSWNKAVLAKYGFVEPITIAPEASKLKISPKDLKSLPATDETVTNSNVDATSLY